MYHIIVTHFENKFDQRFIADSVLMRNHIVTYEHHLGARLLLHILTYRIEDGSEKRNPESQDQQVRLALGNQLC